MKKDLEVKQMQGYQVCADCGGMIQEESFWMGEDENSIGHYRLQKQCEKCGKHISTIEQE